MRKQPWERLDSMSQPEAERVLGNLLDYCARELTRLGYQQHSQQQHKLNDSFFQARMHKQKG